MIGRVGGASVLLCLVASTAFGDYIVNSTFGNAGPAYWNNPSVDGSGCRNIGCLAGGQYLSAQPVDTAALSWATSSTTGLGDFYMYGTGLQYDLSVLLNATANIIAFGIYDVNTGVKTPLYTGDGSGTPTPTAATVGGTFSHFGYYGLYITVTYCAANPTACPPNLINTYYSEASKNGTYQVATEFQTAQHFAVFQQTTPTTIGFVWGAEDGLFWKAGLSAQAEGIGDFQDFALRLSATTPEPGTFALAGLGVAALLALKRRRR